MVAAVGGRVLGAVVLCPDLEPPSTVASSSRQSSDFLRCRAFFHGWTEVQISLALVGSMVGFAVTKLVFFPFSRTGHDGCCSSCDKLAQGGVLIQLKMTAVLQVILHMRLEALSLSCIFQFVWLEMYTHVVILKYWMVWRLMDVMLCLGPIVWEVRLVAAIEADPESLHVQGFDLKYASVLVRSYTGSSLESNEHDQSFCCTRLILPDGTHVEDTVFTLFGLFHRRWMTTLPLLVLRFNSGDTLSLSSVMVHLYLQLNFQLQVHTPDRLLREPPAGHQLV